MAESAASGAYLERADVIGVFLPVVALDQAHGAASAEHLAPFSGALVTVDTPTVAGLELPAGVLSLFDRIPTPVQPREETLYRSVEGAEHPSPFSLRCRRTCASHRGSRETIGLVSWRSRGTAGRPLVLHGCVPTGDRLATAGSSATGTDSLLHATRLPRDVKHSTSSGELVGQRSRIVTAARYTHALVDYTEVDRAMLLERVRPAVSPVLSSAAENAAFAGML